eukprot:4333191-Alexandrium_andersonii.AAC.1
MQWVAQPAIVPISKAARAAAAKHPALIIATREEHCYAVECESGRLPESWHYPLELASLATADIP